MGGIIAAVIAYLIISAIVASYMNQAAKLKGYDREANAFSICFWLGIFGCLYVIALPDKRIQKQNEEIINLLRNKS